MKTKLISAKDIKKSDIASDDEVRRVIARSFSKLKKKKEGK